MSNHAIFRYRQHHLRKHPFAHKIAYYLLVAFILIILVELFTSGFRNIFPHTLTSVFHRISIFTLLKYGLYTLIRLLIAFAAGLFTTFVLLYILAIYPKLEYYFLPVLDILQSVPVLAFFPLIIVAFARLHLPELSAQIILYVAMTWSILFGAIGGKHQIPQDIFDATEIYGATGWKKYTKVILPAVIPNLVTGSILSFGAGWNVIIISEFINYGNIQIRLPGLGNLLSSSAGNDSGVFIAALITLVLIIILIDRLVWHRLIDYSEKFKFE